MKSYPLGVLYTILSAIGLSVIGLIAKEGGRELAIIPFIFWRYLAASILTLLVFGMKKERFVLVNVKMHILRALLVLGAQYSFFYYIEFNSLLNAVVLLNTGPLFIPLFERLFLGRKFEKLFLLAIAIAFLGVLCILQPDKEIFSLMGVIGLFAGACQGGSQVVFGVNSKTEKSLINLLSLFLFCALFSFIPYLFIDVPISPVKEGRLFVFWMIVLIGLASLWTQFFRAEAYRHSNPSKLAAFLYISVIMAALFDFIFYHKVPNLLSVLGALLVILGGILKVWLSQRRSSWH